MQNYPYDDDIMKYDMAAHRYILTKSGVFQELGINLDLEIQRPGRSNTADRFLKKISDSVYSYIYEDSNSAEWLEFQLAKNSALRDIIKEMLLAQVEYILDNNFLDDYSGVNIQKGTAMRRQDLRGSMHVSATVERLCRQDIKGVSYPLKSVFMLPSVPLSLYREGY